MLILAAGDFHGNLQPLKQMVEELRPDLLLSPGDWGDRGEVMADEVRSILELVPVLTVYGNHDDRPLLRELRNHDGSPVLLDQGEIRRAGELRIMGISGIWAGSVLGSRLSKQWNAAAMKTPSLTLEQWLGGRELPPYVTDENVHELCAGVQPPVDFLISHGCALGIADRTPGGFHGGNRCFLEAHQTVNPSVHLCGHLHKSQRHAYSDGRLALNCGDGASGDGWLLERSNGGWTSRPAAI